MFDLHPSHYLSIYKDVFFVCLITMSQIMLLKFLPYLPCFSYGACVHAKSLQSCPTLCDPMGCSSPGCSVHGILQAGIWEWVARRFSRGSSRPRDQISFSYVSCIGRWVLLPLVPPGKPQVTEVKCSHNGGALRQQN